MLLVTKLTIISNLCSSKAIKVMKNSTFFEDLCKIQYKADSRPPYIVFFQLLIILPNLLDKQPASSPVSKFHNTMN